MCPFHTGHTNKTKNTVLHICEPFGSYLHYIPAGGSKKAHPTLLWASTELQGEEGRVPMRQFGLITVLTFNEDLSYPLLLALFHLILSWIFIHSFSSSSPLYLAYISL
jgi:hypothetical protein